MLAYRHNARIRGLVRYSFQTYLVVFFVETIVIFIAIKPNGEINNLKAFDTIWICNELCFIIFVILLLKIKQIDIWMNRDNLDEAKLMR